MIRALDIVLSASGLILLSPLRDWAEALLNEKRLREDAILAPGPIRPMWQQHASGQRRWHYHLWNVLMLQAWLDEHLPVRHSAS